MRIAVSKHTILCCILAAVSTVAGADKLVSSIQTERETILAVRDVVPNYVANRVTPVLHADLERGKHYVLRNRATGRILRTIGRPALREEH